MSGLQKGASSLMLVLILSCVQDKEKTPQLEQAPDQDPVALTEDRSDTAQEAQMEFERTRQTLADPSLAKPALKFWLELLDSNQLRRVGTRHVFHDGDRTKFYVESNLDGYLYVIHQGSDGSIKLLFPSIEAGRENYTRAHQKIMMPKEGYFRFIHPPGKELVAVLHSQEKIPKLEAIASNQLKTPAPELTPEERSGLEATSDHSSKTLVYESDEASYQASSQAGLKNLLSVTFTLNHE